ncbi:hypothetical protein Tco_1123241 [Tanacetum coccineum]|uniref:Uncharacterized protein n=1 Tax=Tanacetum coccineum TaxID=301880 RepID=A0ABQ5J3C4_9ASTR
MFPRFGTDLMHLRVHTTLSCVMICHPVEERDGCFHGSKASDSLGFFELWSSAFEEVSAERPMKQQNFRSPPLVPAGLIQLKGFTSSIVSYIIITIMLSRVLAVLIGGVVTSNDGFEECDICEWEQSWEEVDVTVLMTRNQEEKLLCLTEINGLSLSHYIMQFGIVSEHLRIPDRYSSNCAHDMESRHPLSNIVEAYGMEISFFVGEGLAWDCLTTETSIMDDGEELLSSWVLPTQLRWLASVERKKSELCLGLSLPVVVFSCQALVERIELSPPSLIQHNSSVNWRQILQIETIVIKLTAIEPQSSHYMTLSSRTVAVYRQEPFADAVNACEELEVERETLLLPYRDYSAKDILQKKTNIAEKRRVKLFMPRREERNIELSLGKVHGEISASIISFPRSRVQPLYYPLALGRKLCHMSNVFRARDAGTVVAAQAIALLLSQQHRGI